ERGQHSACVDQTPARSRFARIGRLAVDLQSRMAIVRNPTMPPTRILFVCMGNICRSPTAEGVFLHLVKEQGISDRFLVDSAGVGGWHAGEPADRRALETEPKSGV